MSVCKPEESSPPEIEPNLDLRLLRLQDIEQ